MLNNSIYKKLFDPGLIGNLEVANRIINGNFALTALLLITIISYS
jgi:hypothetical protein